MKYFPIEVFWTILAGLGGVARTMVEINKEGFSWIRLIANIIVAGFSGMMFMLLAKSIGMSDLLVGAVTGIGGYWGRDSLSFLIEIMKGKVK